VLHTEWSDGWGGQEIRIINEMKCLKNSGVKVYLACKDESQIKLKAKENNIEVFTLPFSGNTDLRTVFSLVKIIQKLKIDILNTHSGKDTWVGGIAAKICRIKFIRTRHLSNPINKSKFNFINQLADYIITTGESVKESMINDNRIAPEKICSIPSGPDENVFDPKIHDYDSCRVKFGIEENDFAIGMLSVLRKFKRHDKFLRVARKLIVHFPNIQFKFLIAGEGPQRKNIEDLIKKYKLINCVSLLGHINNQAEFLSSINLFVLASDSGEGVPQSLIQALMMNKLAISTDVGSVKDLYYRDNFKMINKDSEEVLYESVIDIINNNQIYKGMQKLEDGRRFIVENFSEEVMTRKILGIYKKLLDK